MSYCPLNFTAASTKVCSIKENNDMLLKRLNLVADAFCAIIETCQQHPSFDSELFDTHNISELCEIGGDTCDWTMMAITASDALKELEKDVV